jgi:menaquinone-specific isochorismate synthase
MSSAVFMRFLDLAQAELAYKREKIIINWQNVDKGSFVESFDKAQAAFRAGEVKKVVPFSVQRGRLSQTLTLVQKISLLKNLAATPEKLYAYGEWSADAGFMGATPEILFEKRGQKIQTMALAGTSGKDVNPIDFLSDAKERKEHQFVIDDIVEVLAPLGDVHIETTEVVEFPALNHLETRLSVELIQTISTDELIRKMHPTPALGIYPRNTYFEKFRQYPLQHERGFFGAPWGIETKESALLLVAIRKWDWNDCDVQIFAGCGVVQESVLEKEFAEILKKIDSVKRIFFQD